MGLGVPELLIILLIVLVLFGAKRIKNLGSDLGTAIKGFRNAITERDGATKEDTESSIHSSDGVPETEDKDSSNAKSEKNV